MSVLCVDPGGCDDGGAAHKRPDTAAVALTMAGSMLALRSRYRPEPTRAAPTFCHDLTFSPTCPTYEANHLNFCCVMGPVRREIEIVEAGYIFEQYLCQPELSEEEV